MASGGGGGGWADDACQANGERTSDLSLDMCANWGCRGIYEGICRDDGCICFSASSSRHSMSVCLRVCVSVCVSTRYLLGGDSMRDSVPPDSNVRADDCCWT